MLSSRHEARIIKAKQLAVVVVVVVVLVSQVVDLLTNLKQQQDFKTLRHAGSKRARERDQQLVCSHYQV